MRLVLGWFGGVIMRKAHKKQNMLEYGYRVILNVDQITYSMKLPLNASSAEEDSVVGAWVPLKRPTLPSRVSRAGRALTSNVRHKELSAQILSHTRVTTARVPYRHRYCCTYNKYRYVLWSPGVILGTSPGFLIGYNFSGG